MVNLGRSCRFVNVVCLDCFLKLTCIFWFNFIVSALDFISITRALCPFHDNILYEICVLRMSIDLIDYLALKNRTGATAFFLIICLASFMFVFNFDWSWTRVCFSFVIVFLSWCVIIRYVLSVFLNSIPLQHSVFHFPRSTYLNGGYWILSCLF